MTDSVGDAVRAVSQFLIADVPLGETLGRIVELARDAIDPAVAVGVTLLDDRTQPITAVASDGVSRAVDQAQYDDDAGPCLDAFRTGQSVLVDDTRTVAERWPSFSARAGAEGVLSTLALPLNAGGETLGVFNLYSTVPDAFDEQVDRDASLFVTQAAVVLANARAYWQMFDLAAGLQTAMTSRAVIEQAKGVIMSATGCDADKAFALLRQQSQLENRKLREVAEEVARRQGR